MGGGGVYRTAGFGTTNPFFARAQAARQGGGRQGGGPGAASAGSPMLQLVQLLPLLLLLLFTFLSGRSQPTYSLQRTRDYASQLSTATYEVPFWVRDTAALAKDYPPGSRARCVAAGAAGLGGVVRGMQGSAVGCAPLRRPGEHMGLSLPAARWQQGHARPAAGLSNTGHRGLGCTCTCVSPMRSLRLRPPSTPPHPNPLPTLHPLQRAAGAADRVRLPWGTAAAVLQRTHAAGTAECGAGRRCGLSGLAGALQWWQYLGSHCPLRWLPKRSMLPCWPYHCSNDTTTTGGGRRQGAWSSSPAMSSAAALAAGLEPQRLAAAAARRTPPSAATAARRRRDAQAMVHT